MSLVDVHDNSVAAAIIMINNLDFIPVVKFCFLFYYYITQICANYFVEPCVLMILENIMSRKSLPQDHAMSTRATTMKAMSSHGDGL